LPELHANLNLAYDYSQTKGHNNVEDSTQWIYIPTSGCGRIENYSESRKNQLLDFFLNYNKNLESIRSTVEVMGGYSYNYFWKENIDSAMNQALTDTIKAPTDVPTDYVLISFFGRLNYGFMDKYFLTVTLRDDGTSRFSKANRWGLFPSAAFAWKINKEPLIRDITAISDLKLRLGYGVTGQQNLNQGSNGITDYPYLPTFKLSDGTSMYQMGDGYFVNTLRPNWYNATLKWETSTTLDIGLDYGILNNRIYGSFDWYYKKTKDLLSQVAPPVLTNYTNSLLSNVGNMENKGIEFSINANIISKKDLVWSLSYNIGYNKNKITSLTFGNSDPNYYLYNNNSVIQGSISDYAQVQKVGCPANSFYVYQQKYDEKGKPIEGEYVDRNNDSIINSSDLYTYKSPAADILMGISSNLRYKNWDLSFSGRISLGNYNFNNVAANSTYGKMYSTIGYLSNVTDYAKESEFIHTNFHSDYYIEKASFFKMDNISLGYKFTNLFKDNTSLRISFSVLNAFTITKYKGLDPEIYSGLDNNFFPRPRVYMLGLSLDI
jgi:TonB-linked SusC/RagA family outer membrane protein